MRAQFNSLIFFSDYKIPNRDVIYNTTNCKILDFDLIKRELYFQIIMYNYDLWSYLQAVFVRRCY